MLSARVGDSTHVAKSELYTFMSLAGRPPMEFLGVEGWDCEGVRLGKGREAAGGEWGDGG